MVPQAQERKPQVAYKTEIIGGVVVHTPISINQVSWQDPCTVPNPGGKSAATSAPCLGLSVPRVLGAAPKWGSAEKVAAFSMRSWARAFPPHPALMFLHLAAAGPSALEPGFEGSLPAGFCVWLPLLSLPCQQGCAAAFRVERGEGGWVCKSLVANDTQISALGRESTGKASVGALLLL